MVAKENGRIVADALRNCERRENAGTAPARPVLIAREIGLTARSASTLSMPWKTGVTP
jgi:hypothetical protein